MLVERQLGRAGMEMREELIIDCDTREGPSAHQHLLKCPVRGVCYHFINPLEVKMAACVAAGQNCFRFSLLSSHPGFNKIGKLTLG